MRVSTVGATSVKSLQGSETVLGACSFETRTALASLCLGKLQLAVECMNLGRDIKDTGVGLVITSDLCRQAPIVGATGQIHGLMVRRRLATDGVDEPHWERFGGGVADIGGGGV